MYVVRFTAASLTKRYIMLLTSVNIILHAGAKPNGRQVQT